MRGRKRVSCWQSAAIAHAAGLVHLRVGGELAGQHLVRRALRVVAPGASLRVHAAMAFGGLDCAFDVRRHQLRFDAERRARFAAVMAAAMLLLRPRRRAVVGHQVAVVLEGLHAVRADRAFEQEDLAGQLPRFRACVELDDVRLRGRAGRVLHLRDAIRAAAVDAAATAAIDAA